MANYTTQELQEMLEDKMRGEFTSSEENIPESDKVSQQIYLSNDYTQSIHRDSSKGNKIIYSWVQSETVGKRVIDWMQYKQETHTDGNVYYRRSDISQSISTNLTETYSQTGLIIEE